MYYKRKMNVLLQVRLLQINKMWLLSLFCCYNFRLQFSKQTVQKH